MRRRDRSPDKHPQHCDTPPSLRHSDATTSLGRSRKWLRRHLHWGRERGLPYPATVQIELVAGDVDFHNDEGMGKFLAVCLDRRQSGLDVLETFGRGKIVRRLQGRSDLLAEGLFNLFSTFLASPRSGLKFRILMGLNGRRHWITTSLCIEY